MRPHFTDIKLRDLIVLNFVIFVINRKIISLPKVIKYEKRTKSSIDDLSAKSTPCVPLKVYDTSFWKNFEPRCFA